MVKSHDFFNDEKIIELQKILLRRVIIELIEVLDVIENWGEHNVFCKETIYRNISFS